MNPCVKTGLEILLENPPEYLKGQRLGLLCNPASVNTEFKHASKLIDLKFPGQLTTLFSPQHGFYAEKQDNMIESDHFTEPDLNIPVYSLYGETRIPTKTMYNDIDILLIDIQDVGTRVYTFIYTISYCLEIAAELNKKVVILDRPNPIGGNMVEGNLLKKNLASFVGRYEIPMRHGLTVGEISMLFNKEYHINCDLRVIQMSGWRRTMYWRDTGLTWIAPSPNLPCPESAAVYPGQVIFEGTNISEGRGTTQPFEIFGAPFIDTKKILNEVKDRLKGCILRPVCFEPTSGKWAGSGCNGFQIHIVSQSDYRPYFVSLLLLQSIIKFHSTSFEFTPPPYEYELDKMPIDMILGNKSLRLKIENIEPVEQLEKAWKSELSSFINLSKNYFLYD